MFNKLILMACFVRSILEIGGENTYVDFELKGRVSHFAPTVISIKFLLVIIINAYSTPEVMRIKDMITQDEFSVILITSPQHFDRKSMGTR